MAFKDNLLQKIRIDALAARVLASIGPDGGDAKLDRAAMRELLALSSFTPQRERDLDLYVSLADAAAPKVLVLDNELPIYRTSVQDVAMRKSPEVREMVSIGNIIKILKDSDVKISRKADSLKTVHEESIARLDLHFDAEDIHAIRRDGIASIESRYADGVNESLALFAELLGYRVPPKPFVLPHCTRLRRPLPAGQRGDRGGPRGRLRSPAPPRQADRRAVRRIRPGKRGALSPVRGRGRPGRRRGRGGVRTPPGPGPELARQGELTGAAATPRPGETATQGPTATG